MSEIIDYVLGGIHDIHHHGCAGWDAFYRKDYENVELRDEIARLKEEIRRLKNGKGKRKKAKASK